MKCVITADWHCHPLGGRQSALEACIQAIDFVVGEGLRAGCQAMIHCGDVFDDRQSVNIKAMDAVYRAMERADRNGMKPYVLLGNHDMFSLGSWAVNSLASIRGVAEVIDTPRTLTIGGRDWDFMPYTEFPARELAAFRKKGDYLVGHFSVCGAVTNSSGKKFMSRNETAAQHEAMFSGWRRGWLGHFHRPQKIAAAPHISFVGSPLQHNLSDIGQQKGFIVYDIEADVEVFVQNTVSPRYYSFSSLDEVMAADGLTGQHVRLKLPSGSDVTAIEAKRKIVEAKSPMTCIVHPPEYKAGALLTESEVSPLAYLADHGEVVRRYASSAAMSEAEIQIGLDIIRSVR